MYLFFFLSILSYSPRNVLLGPSSELGDQKKEIRFSLQPTRRYPTVVSPFPTQPFLLYFPVSRLQARFRKLIEVHELRSDLTSLRLIYSSCERVFLSLLAFSCYFSHIVTQAYHLSVLA